MSLPTNKGKGVKEDLESGEVESTAGKDEIKKGLPDIRIGKIFLSPKEVKGVEGVGGGIEIIPLKEQVQGEKDAKHNSEILSLAGIEIKNDPEILSSLKVNIKINGKTPVAESMKSQSRSGSESIDKKHNLHLLEDVQVKEGTSGQSQSATDAATDKENEFSVKKGVIGFNSMEKSQLRDTKPSEDEAINDSGVLTTGGLKGDKPVRKNVPEGMKISHSGNAVEDYKNKNTPDISKGFDVKELSVNKGSSEVNTKEREMLLSKNGALHSEGTKEDAITTNQVRTEGEKTQIYKNISSDVVKSERSIGRVVNETPNKQIDTSQLTTQIDFSGIKGIWNGAETSTKSDIITRINFQDVVNQIMDNASNMLKKGSGRIVITIEPPNLGTLNMDVRVQHDTVRMLLIADNHEVKQVLHSNLDQLKTALQGQGLNVDRLDVLVQERHYGGNQGFQPGGGPLFNEGRGRQDNGKEDHLSPQMVPSGGKELDEPSLGIISLFV